MKRRDFLGIAGGALATTALSAYGQNAPLALRTVSYNVLAFRGFPRTEGNRDALGAAHSRLPEITARTLAAFKPDLITFKEAPYEKKVKRFAEALGMNYAFFPGGWKGDRTYPGGFPGAIITRYDITYSENRPSAGEAHPDTLYTRHLGRAELSTPFGKLHVITTHFHAHKQEVRLEEAQKIIELIESLRTTAPVLLQGDLNHTPDAPEYQLWKNAGLIDIGAKMGIGDEPTYPVTEPRIRIDYIWATPDLAEKAKDAAVLSKPPFVPDPKNLASFALSDHMPVMATFPD